jgi:lipopolysaccharide export system protein LptA
MKTLEVVAKRKIGPKEPEKQQNLSFATTFLPIFMSLLVIPLIATASDISDSGSLSSSDASYDGNSLILTGRVILDHGLGKMTAEEASLERQEAGKDFPFSLIQLRKDVLLALKNSAQISCGSAELDFAALKGILHSPENGKVIYTDQLKKKRSKEVSPLKFTSRLIHLNFLKQAYEGKKTEYEIDNILAKEDVVIEYADDFQLYADQAFYRKELPHDHKSSKKEFQGIVTAYPKDEQSQCYLIYQGDEIYADMIDLDLINSKISLLHPKGTLLATAIPHFQKGEMRFQADHLYWDQVKNTLTLKGQISIEEDSLGKLNAEDELQITQVVVEEKHLLKGIYAQGPSTLVYKDAHHVPHRLISSGAVDFNRDKLRASIDSLEKDGVVSQDKQLYYEEEEFAVFANNAFLDYSIADDTVQPSSLILSGNIRLFSHDPQKPLRCGLADRLTYSLTTKTLILSANPGKKVLFWDESQGMRLSAPEVHITYDFETKQQHIKAVGAVQFSFTPDEQNKIQQLFPLLKKLP